VGVNEFAVSDSGGTSLRVERARWVFVARTGSFPVEESDSLHMLLPLLERDPVHVQAGLAELNGPPFPFNEVVETALRSDSGYWQEASVPWLWALELEPTGSLRDAATAATERKLASQRARQDMLRWLRGLPPR
jgi:hypothetical protein